MSIEYDIGEHIDVVLSDSHKVLGATSSIAMC